MATLQGLPLQDLPELVRDSHLEATFHPNADIPSETTHLKYRGRRRPQQERWARQKILGRGGFGIVWLEKREPEGPTAYNFRAVKQLEVAKIRSKQRDCVRELEALAKFSQAKYSEFFVKSYGWFQGPSALFLAMEYCELGDLKDHVEEHGQLGEDQTQDIGWQILQGLRFMHHNNFAHRDLKPANILIKNKPPHGDWHVKICDLGLSKRIGTDATTSTVKGTPGFMPPESIPGIGRDPKHIEPFPADMWCLGETIFYLLTRERTFGGDLIRLRQYWKGGPFPKEPLLRVFASNSTISFIQGLMARLPAQRLTAEMADQHELMKAEPIQEVEQGPREYSNERESVLKMMVEDTSSGRWTTEASDQQNLWFPSGSWDTTTVEAQLDTMSMRNSPGKTELVSEDSRRSSSIQTSDRRSTDALYDAHELPVTDYPGDDWGDEDWGDDSDESREHRPEEEEEEMDDDQHFPAPALQAPRPVRIGIDYFQTELGPLQRDLVALKALSYTGMRKLRQRRAEFEVDRLENPQAAFLNDSPEAASDEPQGILGSGSDTEPQKQDVKSRIASRIKNLLQVYRLKRQLADLNVR